MYYHIKGETYQNQDGIIFFLLLLGSKNLSVNVIAANHGTGLVILECSSALAGLNR